MNVILIFSGSAANDGTGNSLRSASAIVNYDVTILDTSASLNAQTGSVLVLSSSLNAQTCSILAASASAASVTGSITMGILRRWTSGWAWDDFEEYQATGSIRVLNKGYGWLSDGVASTGSSIITRSMNEGFTLANNLSLNNAQIGRKLPFGDSWHRILMLVLFRVNNTASLFTADGYMGLCNGTSSMVADASTNNFIGIRWSGNNGNPDNWKYASGSVATGSLRGNYKQSTSTGFVTRRSTTTTSQGSGAGSDGRTFAGGNPGLGLYSFQTLEISRPVFTTDTGSVSYTLAMRSTDSGSVEFAVAKSMLIDILSEPPNSTLGGEGSIQINAGGSGVVSQAVSFDQSTGKFDTFTIYWPQTCSMEIAAIGVRKMY